jgi:hypothetical protein
MNIADYYSARAQDLRRDAELATDPKVKLSMRETAEAFESLANVALLLALDFFGWGALGLYAYVAVGIIAYAVLLAISTTRRAWHAA